MAVTRRSQKIQSEKPKDEEIGDIQHNVLQKQDATADNDKVNNSGKMVKKKNDGNKLLKKKRKEKLKSKNTGVGLKIPIDSSITKSKPQASSNKIVFDDSNLPPLEDDDTDGISLTDKGEEDKGGDDNGDDDDDAIEEVLGSAAREEITEQLKTEEKQSLKSRKRRKRNAKKRGSIKKSKKGGDEKTDDDDKELDDEFFSQLDAVRGEEFKERKELQMLEARAAKGKHTNFVFSKNHSENYDNDEYSEPIKVGDNMSVMVLKNLSTISNVTTKEVSSTFGSISTISNTALVYSRNQLIDGSDASSGAKSKKSNERRDPAIDDRSTKRQKNRSGEEIRPWKRAKQKLSLGRSRMRQGRPATFFRKKR